MRKDNNIIIHSTYNINVNTHNNSNTNNNTDMLISNDTSHPSSPIAHIHTDTAFKATCK